MGKKNPMTAGTQQLYLRMQGSASLLRAKNTPLTAGTQQLYLCTQGSASLPSLTTGTHPVKAYVPLSVLSECVRTYWSIGRSTTMNRGRVRSSTCHSRAPHVAVQAVPSKSCTHTYSHTPKNTATYVDTGRVSNAYSRIRTARSRVHGWVRTEKLHRHVHGEATECVMFMGRQRNASCSSGGNGIRRVHREPTGLDGTADRNEARLTAERRKRPSVRPTMFGTGSC